MYNERWEVVGPQELVGTVTTSYPKTGMPDFSISRLRWKTVQGTQIEADISNSDDASNAFNRFISVTRPTSFVRELGRCVGKDLDPSL